MRNAMELANDLFTLNSNEWNLKLSEEYDIPYDQFIMLVNTYSYMSTSEDAIHSRMKPLHVVKPNEPKRSDSEEIVQLVTPPTAEENALRLSSIIRDLGSLFMDSGTILNQIIMCGFICENSELSSILIKSSVINNCLFAGSNFQNSKIVQTKFIDCDFSNCDLRGVTFAKSQFYDCVFNEAQLSQISMFDVVLYKCQIQHSDGDDSTFVTTSIHDCDFSNTHLKRTSIISSVLSYSTFNNTILNDAELFDTNLISIDFSSAELKGIVLCDCPATSLQIDAIYADLFGFTSGDMADDSDDSSTYSEEDDDDDKPEWAEY